MRAPRITLSVSRSLRRAAGLVLAVAALAVVVPVSQARPPSDSFEGLVDVGGHSLYVKCIGRGGPTVILDAALGNTSATWAQIQPEVARFTTVCSYDRAGLGRSERGPVPRTSQTAVDELQALLTTAGIRGPYVLVGHSLGGYHVQLFARQDGGRRVTGVVLVDATPIDWPQVLDRFGIPTPGPTQNPEDVDIRASGSEVQAAPAFPNVPLSVLLRGVWAPPPPDELKRAWEERQLAQSRLSCRGELVVAEGAGHFIQRDRPDVVIAAIERVVEAAGRNRGRRLNPQGKQSPATRRGGAGKGRWRKCPGEAQSSSAKRARRRAARASR